MRYSPLFDPATGFGAYEAGGCIGDGPFKGAAVHVGPNVRYTDHCTVRNFLITEDLRPIFTQANFNNILSQTNYDNLWNSMDGFPFKTAPALHDSGHGFMGGDMASYYTSTNDPVFYLHHAGVDRIWWQWQAANLNTRLNQIQGKTSPYPPYGSITPNFQLPFQPFAPNVVGMDIRNEPYCYTY